MATRVRGKNEVDLIDVVALMLLPITSSMIFEVFSFQINVFGGYDFTQAIWTVANAGISLALILTVGAAAWIIVTNLLNEQTDQEPLEFGVIVLAILLPILHVFVPAISELVMYHDLTQLISMLYVAGAAVWVSYVG